MTRDTRSAFAAGRRAHGAALSAARRSAAQETRSDTLLTTEH